MYDAVWELPKSVLDDIEGVKPGTTRHILHACARRTNPTRDLHFEWFAAAETIAEDAEVNVRSVQRVYSVFIERGWIEVVATGVRNGRHRDDQERRTGARSPRYRACIERWPVDERRRLANSRDVHVVTNGDSALVATRTALVATPAPTQTVSGDAGVAESALVATPASPKPGTSLTRNSGAKPVIEPAAAARRAMDTEDERSSDHHDDGSHQGALFPAVPLGTTPGPPLAVNVERWPCPDCSRPVTADGDGHRRDCRAYAIHNGRRCFRGGKVQRCCACPEWIDSRNPAAVALDPLPYPTAAARGKNAPS